MTTTTTQTRFAVYATDDGDTVLVEGDAPGTMPGPLLDSPTRDLAGFQGHVSIDADLGEIDANYLSDLANAESLLRDAIDQLNTVVGGGYADHDSDVGAACGEIIDTLSDLAGRCYAASNDTDYRVAGLLRGARD